jgi:hypothetical protein
VADLTAAWTVRHDATKNAVKRKPVRTGSMGGGVNF